LLLKKYDKNHGHKLAISNSREQICTAESGIRMIFKTKVILGAIYSHLLHVDVTENIVGKFWGILLTE